MRSPVFTGYETLSKGMGSLYAGSVLPIRMPVDREEAFSVVPNPLSTMGILDVQSIPVVCGVDRLSVGRL